MYATSKFFTVLATIGSMFAAGMLGGCASQSRISPGAMSNANCCCCCCDPNCVPGCCEECPPDCKPECTPGCCEDDCCADQSKAK